jgi:hypothetical protein
MITCNKCGEKKSLNHYQKRSKKTKAGVQRYRQPCKECRNELRKKDRIKFFQRIKRKFGLTEENYLQMKSSQNNQCWICYNDFSDEHRLVHIDHDKKTGKVRGILCQSCNHGLGHFKDNIESLKNAIRYLEKELRIY